ncbi:MAG TPA: DinB family protein [Candidatus Eisenbacteria bacterium]|nr:DinB family protein [Candidatus Eisenbacteria bacterium]
MPRPEATEFNPYYGRYIEKVPDGPIVDVLTSGMNETLTLLRSIPESRADHRYAEGKWSIKEVVGHVIDGERVFTYRALRFARKDTTPLASFEQDDYIPAGNFGARTLRDLTDEYEAVRRATIELFRHFDETQFSRRGTAADSPVSVRALAYITAGHEIHHRAILRERYLGQEIPAPRA